MKKTLLLLSFAIISLVGCTNNAEETGNPLQNTIWENATNEDVINSLEFISETNCILTVTVTSTGEELVFFYEYIYGGTTVFIAALEDDNADLKGTISGNTIDLVNTYSEESLGSFTRK